MEFCNYLGFLYNLKALHQSLRTKRSPDFVLNLQFAIHHIYRGISIPIAWELSTLNLNIHLQIEVNIHLKIVFHGKFISGNTKFKVQSTPI